MDKKAIYVVVDFEEAKESIQDHERNGYYAHTVQVVYNCNLPVKLSILYLEF